MKKFLALILAFIMLFSISCGGADDSINEDNENINNNENEIPDIGTSTSASSDNLGSEENSDDSIDKDNENINNNENEIPDIGTSTSASSDNLGSEENSNVINLADAHYIGKCSNGLMKVTVSGPGSSFFINKKGERVLDMPEGVVVSEDHFFGQYFPGSKYDDNLKNSVNVLFDKTGKVTYPSDIGVTDFMVEKNDVTLKMLEDGYIIAEIVKDSYLGSETTLCIFDNDFKKLADLSGIIEIDDLYRHTYFNGFLYNNDKVVDVRTGKVYANFVEASSQITLKYESDWWKYVGDDYVDIRDPEKKSVFPDGKFPETKYGVFEFSCGYSSIMFRTYDEGSSRESYFFSIIDEQGNMLFEPVKLSGEANIKSCNGVYAVATAYDLCVFDKTGKIAETKYEGDYFRYVAGLSFSEDVIVVERLISLGKTEVHVYTPELKPLF